MKKFLFFVAILFFGNAVSAQKVDSIFFHLYTDSLKKCQHNYINVDAKLSNGNWKPLTEKELQFSSPDAKFEGNELVIPCDFKPDKVAVKAALKSNPSIWIEKIIWIKRLPDPEKLPTAEEILRQKPKKRNKSD